MQGRIGLLEAGGGDLVQIENTAKELKLLGVDVDIKTGFDVDFSLYDIVHIFQLDWTPESFFYAKKAKEAGKPVVLSPIHHSVKEVAKFEEQYAFGFRRLTKTLFEDQFTRDTVKDVYRSLKDKRKLMPTLASMFLGLKNLHLGTLGMANTVLVQTEQEARDLEETYGVQFNWEKVSNGVGKNFLEYKEGKNPLGIKDYIISIGRIEPRKNHLKVVEAVKRFRQEYNLDIPLVFIGLKREKVHFEYTFRFDRELKRHSWIRHLDYVPYEDMPAYYHFAKVCVSASWFETTGLTSLEALFCSTNAVAAGARAKECLGEYSSYCSPDSVTSIKDAIAKEYFAPRPHIDDSMRSEYTWENAARKTLAVYETLL